MSNISAKSGGKLTRALQRRRYQSSWFWCRWPMFRNSTIFWRTTLISDGSLTWFLTSWRNGASARAIDNEREALRHVECHFLTWSRSASVRRSWCWPMPLASLITGRSGDKRTAAEKSAISLSFIDIWLRPSAKLMIACTKSACRKKARFN